MDTRVLLKNYTVLALAAGVLIGLILGLLLGNLALGVILIVGILVGGLALLDELGIDFQQAVDERLGRASRPVPPRVTPKEPVSSLRGAEEKPAISPIPPVRETPPTQQPEEVDAGAASAPEAKPAAAPKVAAEPRAAAQPDVATKPGATAEPKAAKPEAAEPGAAEPETAAAPVVTPEAKTAPRASPTTKAEPKTVVLVAGTGQQLDKPAPAAELYSSPLFQLSMTYAQAQQADAVYVLSAKHILLAPDAVVTPYEESLSTMTTGQLKAWSDKVLRELRKVTDTKNDRFILLAAGKYRKHLEAELEHVELPTEGMTLGQQMEFLKEQTP